MRANDQGNYFFIANPVAVDSVKNAAEALRDSLAGEDIHPSDVDEIILRFKTRIREVKSHG
jgi:hypothetical protein